MTEAQACVTSMQTSTAKNGDPVEFLRGSLPRASKHDCGRIGPVAVLVLGKGQSVLFIQAPLFHTASITSHRPLEMFLLVRKRTSYHPNLVDGALGHGFFGQAAFAPAPCPFTFTVSKLICCVARNMVV